MNYINQRPNPLKQIVKLFLFLYPLVLLKGILWGIMYKNLSFSFAYVVFALPSFAFIAVALELKSVIQKRYYARWISISLVLLCAGVSLIDLGAKLLHFNGTSYNYIYITLEIMILAISSYLLYLLTNKRYKSHVDSIKQNDTILNKPKAGAKLKSILKTRPLEIKLLALFLTIYTLFMVYMMLPLWGDGQFHGAPMLEPLLFTVIIPSLLIIGLYRGTSWGVFFFYKFPRVPMVFSLCAIAALGLYLVPNPGEKIETFLTPAKDIKIFLGFLMYVIVLPELVFKRANVRLWLKSCFLARSGGTQEISMNNVTESSAKLKLNFVANVLIVAGIIFFLIDLAQAVYLTSAASIFNFHVSLSGLAPIIIGIILKYKGYKAARRITFIVAIAIVSMLFNPIMTSYLMHMPWQLVKLQYLSLLGLIELTLFLAKLCIATYVYWKLSDKTIIAAAQRANVPYKSFWRYSPARGFIVAGALLLIFPFISQNLIFSKLKLTEPLMKSIVKMDDINPNYKYWINSFKYSASFKPEEPKKMAISVIYYTNKKIIGTANYNWQIYSTKNKIFTEQYTKANEGDKKAQFELALMYFFNLGNEVDPKQGFAWALRSANQGFKPAQKLVASAYKTGLGTAVDEAKSKAWLAKFKFNA